jgi:hypothetical protein
MARSFDAKLANLDDDDGRVVGAPIGQEEFVVLDGLGHIAQLLVDQGEVVVGGDIFGIDRESLPELVDGLAQILLAPRRVGPP